MTMNREMLLERLKNQYLTRQEVLFRLPLNISIDSFWPELVQRRKLSCVVLPLHRADGKPLWYVLTNRMIAASERLCALALDSADQIDPYKAELTGAMTEELFFTGFVEGADQPAGGHGISGARYRAGKRAGAADSEQPKCLVGHAWRTVLPAGRVLCPPAGAPADR